MGYRGVVRGGPPPLDPPPLDLGSIGDVATELQVSRQRADVISRDRANGFPEPIGIMRGGRVWDMAQVRAWAYAHRNNTADRRSGVDRRQKVKPRRVERRSGRDRRRS